MDEEIKDEMGMVYGTQGQKRNAHRILVGKAKGNKSLGRQKKCRWENNIKTYHKEIGWEGMQ